jgi:flagellar biosynthesis protein FlhG
MLPERMMDQAAGLRRLLARTVTPVVTVAGGRAGLGATSLVVNLAATLARDGKDVLVLDENMAHDNVANSLALRPRYDLLHAVRGDKSLREVMHVPVRGMQVLPVARAMQELSKLATAEHERLLACVGEASLGMDAVLVDGSVAGGRFVSGSLAPDQPLLVVINATASALTESYALIKRMTLLEGRRDFDIVASKVRDAAEAKAVFGNLAEVARRHLGVRVEYWGHIPVDEKLKRATQLCRPVVEAFPQAPSAQAFADLGRRLMSLPAAEEGGEAVGLSRVVQRLIGQTRTPNMAHII